MASERPGPILIRGGRVIDPSRGTDVVADLLLVNGRIASDGTSSLPVMTGTTELDATDQVVCPGFVDLHTHLRYPGFPDKETIESGTAAAAAGGFTTVCAMANTMPAVDSVPVLRDVLAECRRAGRVHVRQLGAVSVGLQGEQLADLSALARHGAVAFSDDGKPVWDAGVMETALIWSARLGTRISVHEEDPSIVRDGVANAGDRAARHHLSAWPCAGEASMVERDRQILERVGGRLHIAHVSCAETIALVRSAQSRGLDITAEVTPHHLCLTEEVLDGDDATGMRAAHPCCKVNPPLRAPHDVDALVGALADGTIQAVATDHAPHTRADKDASFAEAAFGFTALETALPLLLQLERAGRLPMPVLVERMTLGPARIFDLPAGTLREGAPADVCVFDPHAPWHVSPQTLYSRGKNTPLMGARMVGRVTNTIVGGALIHTREMDN